MKVALVHEAVFPVYAYGGTERAVWWLAKGLAERGHEVTLVCKPGSTCPFARTAVAEPQASLAERFADIEVFHFFNTPRTPPPVPYVVTIEGNGKEGEEFLPNTAFVSRNHATRHGAECFVYNGLDPADYQFRERKSDSLLFLAKAAWHVKNVRGAIRLARRAGRAIDIVGGSRLIFRNWRGARWRGMLGGQPKAELIAQSSALLFPVLWDEPFGIAVTEALVSGTPVFATPWGSLPELVAPEVGAICRSEEEFLDAISRLGNYRAEACRAHALKYFTYGTMAERYLELYARVRRGETLNPRAPRATTALGNTYSLPSRTA